MPLARRRVYGQWPSAHARDGCRVVESQVVLESQVKAPPGVMLDIQDEFDPPFEAIEPAECRGPVLFNSPHSGRIYPRAFLLASRLDLATLRRSEDSFVDDLIAGVGG